MSPGARAQEEPVRPDIFRSAATAQGVQFMADRAGLLPVPEAFRFIVLDGDGTYEPYNQTARASLFFPGNGVVKGPALACATAAERFPADFAPIFDTCQQYEYPLTVFADALDHDGAAAGSLELGSEGDPISAHAVSATAHAALDGSTSDAALADLRIIGLDPSDVQSALPIPGLPELDSTILSVDNMVARTDQHIDGAGALVVDATTTLEGISLAGGLIEIGAIRSASQVTDDGTKHQSHHADLEVGGVTVGGVPAKITHEGLVLDGPQGGGPQQDQLETALNDMLRELGMEVTLLDTDDGVDDYGLAFARSGGVLVEFSHDVSGAPILPGPMGDLDLNGTYVGSMVLGATGVSGVAATIPEITIDPPIVPPITTPPGTPTVDPPDTSTVTPTSVAPVTPTVAPSSPVVPSGTGPSVGVDSGPGIAVPRVSAPKQGRGQDVALPPAAAPVQQGQAGPQQLVSVTDPLVADLRWVYLALSLSVLGLAVSPTFSFTARLPRSAS